MEVSDSLVNQLVSMGFDASQAKTALQNCGGNVDQAVDLLLGVGGSNHAPTAASLSPAVPSTSTTMVSGDVSQYSVENGRSACTCIGLMAAVSFLQGRRSTSDETVTKDFLNAMVTCGVEAYQKLSREASVEHMSAEEVLQQKAPEFAQLSIVGDVRQGLLARDRNHPMGLKVLLEGVRQETADSNTWMAVLITKTPETVVVCLPPPHLSTFTLLDSHPRSQFEGAAASSYARIHGSLLDLVTSLETIFPETDLGPDTPEMMAMMYNSFDLYPLVLRAEP